MNQNIKGFKYFMIIWSGEFISSISTGMTAFALAVYVFKTEHNATSVALVVLASFLPIILLGPIAGVLADRFDRRLLMMLGDGLSTIGLFVILYAFWNNSLTLSIILVGVSISAVWTSLLDPAYKATISDLISENEFSKASGLVQLAGASKYLISPMIAGFLLTIINLDVIIIIDISTLFITVIATFIVKKQIHINKQIPKKQHVIQDFKEGVKTLINQKAVLILLIVLSSVTFFVGFVQTLYTPMLLSITNEKILGIVESISALGLLVGSLYISIKDYNSHFNKMIMFGILFMGSFILMLGTSTNLLMIGIWGFLLFASLPFINTGAEVLIRKNIPNDTQGRVWGLIGFISQLGYIFSYILAGLLADYIFNPMLVKGGILANSIGRVIGFGEGRGIGLMFILSGMLILIFGLILVRIKTIKNLEINYAR